MGGNDAASPRYIHTEINPITDLIYRKEDFPLLKYLDDLDSAATPNFVILRNNERLGIAGNTNRLLRCLSRFKKGKYRKIQSKNWIIRQKRVTKVI